MMPNARVLIVPGAASPTSPAYLPVYSLIENEARSRGGDVITVVFPGQCIAGTVSFVSAVRCTARIWERFDPTWVIARSFGCVVLAKLLSDKRFEDSLNGAVLWGPTLSHWVKRFLPTECSKRREVERYQRHGTNLEPLFFDEFPALEVLMEGMKADIRLVRGGLDKFNSREDLRYLAAIHRCHNPNNVRDIVEIESLEHSVRDRSVCSPKCKAAYLKALFSPIRRNRPCKA